MTKKTYNLKVECQNYNRKQIIKIPFGLEWQSHDEGYAGNSKDAGYGTVCDCGRLDCSYHQKKFHQVKCKNCGSSRLWKVK